MEDLDATAGDDERPGSATARDGDEPVVRSFDTVDDHDANLLVHLEELAARTDTCIGDMNLTRPSLKHLSDENAPMAE